MGTVLPSFHYKYMQYLVLYSIQFAHITIFMSLHGPAGACIPPIDVPPIQRVLKHYCAYIILLLSLLLILLRIRRF